MCCISDKAQRAFGNAEGRGDWCGFFCAISPCIPYVLTIEIKHYCFCHENTSVTVKILETHGSTRSVINVF